MSAQVQAYPSGRTFAELGLRGLFLVWGEPQGSHRSELMAQQLGLELRYVCFSRQRGRRIAPIKYFFQLFMTMGVLMRHRYRVIFVQDPPIFAVLPVYVYSLFTGARFVIDSHTDALQASWWKPTLPLHRFLEHRAVTTVVTNDQLRELIESWGEHGFTLADPPAEFDFSHPFELADDQFSIVMVSTADYDEPVEEVLAAARDLPQVTFYITGDFDRAPHLQQIKAGAPPNAHFTGYLRQEYFTLLNAVDVVMCLTTEDNTFLSGDNEALWLGKPIITSDWPLLRGYFSRGTIYVDNTTASVRQAVLSMVEHFDTYQAEILALRQERWQDWWAKADKLVQMVQDAISS